MRLSKNFQPVFLKWLLLICLIGVGSFFAFWSGLIAKVNEVDFTKISFFIFGVFWYFSIKTGMLTYSLSRHCDTADMTRRNEEGWFFADAFTYAGMIGTVIGFICMMSGPDFSNVSSANVQNVIIFALGKMGLALYTTAAGLVCSLLLKIQLFNVSQYLQRIKDMDNAVILQ